MKYWRALSISVATTALIAVSKTFHLIPSGLAWSGGLNGGPFGSRPLEVMAVLKACSREMTIRTLRTSDVKVSFLASLTYHGRARISLGRKLKCWSLVDCYVWAPVPGTTGAHQAVHHEQGERITPLCATVKGWAAVAEP